MNTECHLYILPRIESIDDNDSSSDESDLEVISIIDDTEDAAIALKDMLNIDDDDDDTNSEEAANDQQSPLIAKPSNTSLDAVDIDPTNEIVSIAHLSMPTSSTIAPNSVEASPLNKRKDGNGQLQRNCVQLIRWKNRRQQTTHVEERKAAQDITYPNGRNKKKIFFNCPW